MFWWGQATREWWALIGTTGYEAQTLDELLVKVRASAAAGGLHRAHTTPVAPAASQLTQSSAAGHAPRHHPLGSAHHPETSSVFPPRYVDRITGRRPGWRRRLLEGVRRFLIAEGEVEVW